MIFFDRSAFKQILEKNDLNQKEFADRAGISISTLKRFLTGDMPQDFYVSRIAHAFSQLDHHGIQVIKERLY